MKKIFVIIALMMLGISVKGQDIQFSQFYAAPIFLNPAFAGSSEMTRFGVNYRNQFPGMDHSLNAYSTYLDHYSFSLNSGFGIIANGVTETMSNLRTSEIGAVYSYRLQLGFNSFLRFGGQASFVSRDADFSSVIFGSMIDPLTGEAGLPSGENLGLDVNHRYLDYHFGMLYTNEMAWLGVSAHHITQPNISFVDDQIAKWPIKYSVHGGISFDLGSGMSRNYMNNVENKKLLVLAFNYKHQDPFNQLDLGTQLVLQPLTLGVWYRGLPTPGLNRPNTESLIGVVGISLGNGLDIGYSYDYTLTKLGIANTSGAHEVSMRFSFLAGSTQNAAGRKSSMPCFRY
ncbi:PorP/SprF family type IX secretion system membrane protein [Mongoliitalea lutea]|uniref:Membrane protein n=1 Tax=Mongoliitalea lutea TaxID=849756 RepID=A0A8J3G6R7_9BACT|nr:type IX secretion system membrane protein PorP/SprF [Mongoliitalea lutea]GHB47277.1 membrane protein [Mongoliitalea lutea]